MPHYFYRDKAGQEIGPLTLDALAKLRYAGVLNDDSTVRVADSAEWKLCREIIAAPVQPLASQLSHAPVAKSPFSPILIAIVIIGALVYGGMALYKSAAAKTTLTYGFSVDGKELSSLQQPEVQVDGQPFSSGGHLKPGKHEISVALVNVEPFKQKFWVYYGDKNLGTLPLESSKGSLSVTVNPSPATVIVQRGGEIVHQSDAPLSMDKLTVGDYMLTIHRGEYTETRSAKVQREQETKVQVDLNLGSVDLSADPADADFVLSGNARRWQGKLPAKIDDVPGGNYSLAVSRKGWDLKEDISISRASVLTNKIVFPYGSIEISSDPTGLVISTNGVEIGKTPMTLLEIIPGQYAVAVSDGENDLKANVSVAPKEAAKQAFTFHYGVVQLTSTPAGATVIRKGKGVGKTPLTLNHIPAGDIAVELRLQDYASTNFVIQAVEGVTTDLSVKLISEHYLADLNNARWAASAATPDYHRALESISQALVIYPDDVEALQLKKDYEFELAQIEASQAFRSNDLDTALNKVDTALALKPSNSEAFDLKEKIIAAKLQRDKLAAAQAEQLSTERHAAAGREFDHAVAIVLGQEKNFLIAQSVQSQPWDWTARTTPSQARAALLRATELCAPKWRVAKEYHPASDETVIYLHPVGLLATGDLVVQICQLPDNAVDVRAQMAMGVLQDQNQNDYTQSMKQIIDTRFYDFRMAYSSELKSLSSNP